MQNTPLFRFTLLGDLGTLVLRDDPVGFDELGISLHRDPKLHGVTTEYAELQLGFVKAGKQYLETAYGRRGIEAEVTLLIEQYNPNNFLWYPYYRGRIDFTAREVTPTEFRCNLEQEGFTQRFLNRDDTPVDVFKSTSVSGMPLAALAPVSVELHSRSIVKRFESRVPDPAPPGGVNYVTDGQSRFQTLYFGFGGSAERNEFGLQQVQGGPVTVPENNDSPQIPIYPTTERGVFRFDFQILSELVIARQDGQGDFDSVDGGYYFRINDEPPQALLTIRDRNIGGTYRRTLSTNRVQLSRTLEIGDRIYLYGDLHVFDISGNVLGNYNFPVTLNELPGSYFIMEAETQTEPSQCEGLLAYEALNRLAQAMTDQATAFRSDFFGRTDTSPAYPVDGEGAALLVASGFQVRGFPLSAKPLTLAWRGLFDSLQAIHWLGAGIERLPGGREVVRIEPVPYFYADEVVLELPAPVSLRTRTLTDRHYAGAEIGYQKWQTEKVNGLDEFNAKREWTTPLTNVKAKYAALSSCVTSGFYLESTRRQRYDATATTDDARDADTFLVSLLRTATGFETERDQRFAEVSGVFSASTAYNLRLSPARMLRRHGPALAAGLRHERGRKVRFAAGEGNNALRTQLLTETDPVTEGADVPVSQLAPPLWLPEQYVFTAPLSREQLARLLQNPRGRIRFYDEQGQRCEGWIMDFKHKPLDGVADFELLACAAMLPLGS